MQYFVYVEGMNHKKIVPYNIFSHNNFNSSVVKLCKEYLKNVKKSDYFVTEQIIKDFKKDLRRELMYYFWCKAEWEIVLTSWTPTVDANEIQRLNDELNNHRAYQYTVEPIIAKKIDVFSQIDLNFDVFANYVIENVDKIAKGGTK